MGRWTVKDNKATAIRNTTKQTTYIRSDKIWKAHKHQIPTNDAIHKECDVTQFQASTQEPIGIPARAWLEMGKIHYHARSRPPIESNATGWQQQLERDVPFQWLNQDIHYKCTLAELKELLV